MGIVREVLLRGMSGDKPNANWKLGSTSPVGFMDSLLYLIECEDLRPVRQASYATVYQFTLPSVKPKMVPPGDHHG